MHEPTEFSEPTDDVPRADLLPRSAEGLFHHGPIAEQLEQQISLLTQAMTESMIFASGAFPDLIEGELPEPQDRGFFVGPRPLPKRGISWPAARSLQLHDAARLSFATASLVGALTKLKAQPGQRFTTRQTFASDPRNKKRQHKVTTVTHTLYAPRDDAVAVRGGADKPLGATPSKSAP